jgi:predicted MFS family arabinose efflux permease
MSPSTALDFGFVCSGSTKHRALSGTLNFWSGYDDYTTMTARPIRKKQQRNNLTNEVQAGQSLWLLVGLFMFSGATSLVYQTLWVRQLSLVVGTSVLAICTVLAAFMGGLAIGSFLAGRLAARIRRPVRAYAFLELFIGGYALVFPVLFTK